MDRRPSTCEYVVSVLQSPFSGEDEDELFDSICNHQVSFSRYLDQTTISFLDKKVNFWYLNSSIRASVDALLLWMATRVTFFTEISSWTM